MSNCPLEWLTHKAIAIPKLTRGLEPMCSWDHHGQGGTLNIMLPMWLLATGYDRVHSNYLHVACHDSIFAVTEVSLKTIFIYVFTPL